MMKIVRILRNMDWFYEFRPLFVFIFGLIGLFNRSMAADRMWLTISQTCGLVLIVTALKICQWRYQYRKHRPTS